MPTVGKKRAIASCLSADGAAGEGAEDGRRFAEQGFVSSSDGQIIDGQAGAAIHLKDNTGRLRFWPFLLPNEMHKRLFDELTLSPGLNPAGQKNTQSSGSSSTRRVEEGSAGRWRQRPIKLFGREIPQPRLTCFYGRKGITYKYSGKTLEASPWEGVSSIQEILRAIEAAAGVGGGYFNCVLLNWYRDGNDYMGWHSDNEKELEKRASIASVSLGSERRFQLRRKTDNKQKVEFRLCGGSLLLMEGSTQEHWQHRVPKRKAAELKEEELARSKKCRLPDASESSIPSFSDGRRREPSIEPPSRRQRDRRGSEQPNDALLFRKGGKEGMLGGGRGSSSSSSSSSSGKRVLRGGRGSKEEGDCGIWPTGAGRVNLTFRRVENNSSKTC